jgi:transposase
VKRIQQEYPEAEVELWSMDEHRIGLKPLLRRVWVRKGSRPCVSVQTRSQWMYVYGFVCPQTGQTEWWLLPTVMVAVMNLALAHFARAVGAGASKQVVLVLDRAGWHSSPQLVVPEGLHLLFLPPYSPELQPCERLWPLSNEGVANRSFPSLDDLEQAQVHLCQTLLIQSESIRAVTFFQWWPDVTPKLQ